MNDNTVLENYLLVLKSNVEVFVHGTLESSFSDIQSLLKDCLASTIDMQRNTYTLMTELGIYNVTKVDSSVIKDCLVKNNFE